MDACKALQLANGRGDRGGGVAGVELHDFVACTHACVAHVYADGEGVVGGQGGGVELEVAVGEGGVAETVAEGVEGGTCEVAVGAVCHAVVGEGGQVADGLVEGDGEASGGVVVAKEDVGDGGSACLARIPCF